MTGLVRRHWPLAVLWVLLWVTRLPQLIDNPFLPDGDEALLGVVARHIAAGEAPVFLWGQRYALVLVEEGPVALLFRVFGESETALRCGPLLCWTTGVVLMAAAVQRLHGRRASILTGALLGVCPAWMGVSVRAWATSCPGFFFAALSIWSATWVSDVQLSRRASTVAALVTGAALGLSAFSHPLWGATTIPVVVALGWRRWRLTQAFVAEAAGVAVALPLALVAAKTHTYWQPDLFRSPEPLRALGLLPARWLTACGGTYFLTTPTPSPSMTRLVAPVWAAVSMLSVGVVAVALSRRLISWVLVLGVPIPLALAVVCDPGQFGYRYLLPGVTYAIILLAVVAAASRTATWALVPLIAVGLWGAVEFRQVSSRGGYDPEHHLESVRAMDSLLASLETRGIRDVYSRDGMLQWTLMFASQGRVTARWHDPVDRYPAFPREVDCALAHGDPVAVAGRTALAVPASARPAEDFGNYFVVPEPTGDEIRAEGFVVTPCASGSRGATGGTPL